MLTVSYVELVTAAWLCVVFFENVFLSCSMAKYLQRKALKEIKLAPSDRAYRNHPVELQHHEDY